MFLFSSWNCLAQKTKRVQLKQGLQLASIASNHNDQRELSAGDVKASQFAAIFSIILGADSGDSIIPRVQNYCSNATLERHSRARVPRHKLSNLPLKMLSISCLPGVTKQWTATQFELNARHFANNRSIRLSLNVSMRRVKLKCHLRDVKSHCAL